MCSYYEKQNTEIEKIIEQEIEKAKMEIILRDKLDILTIIQGMTDNDELEILKQKLKERESNYFK